MAGHFWKGVGENDELLFHEQQRLAVAYEEALENAAIRCEQAGRLTVAVNYARRLLALNPQSEETCTRLLRLLVRSGERTAAIRAYETFARRFRDANKGLPLSAPLQRLGRSLRPEQANSGTSDSVSAQPSRTDSLPVPLTRYFGRENEIKEILGHLDQESPSILTILGVGGCGKTRLAIEVARKFTESSDPAAQPDHPGSRKAFFVPLEGVLHARQLYPAVYRAVQIGGSREDNAALRGTVARLLRSAASRPLLILDNCEHLAGEPDVLAVLSDLLQRVPGLSLLATSRRPLALRGEQLFPLLPLQVPLQESGKNLAAYSCVQLFLDRTAAVRRDFQLSFQNEVVVSGLCARLEGLPLAIELCAAWAATLTPEQMLAELEHRFDLLVSRLPDVAPRQRSMRAAIETSYALLTEELQRLFASLAVFRGGWFAEAAQAVTGRESVTLRNDLAKLQEQSLLVVDVVADSSQEDNRTRMRFRLLDTLREFAVEQLSAEESTEISERHAAFFLQLAETAAPFLYGRDQRRWMDALEQEMDNIRAAIRFCDTKGLVDEGLRLCVALRYFWNRRGHQREACESFALFLRHLPDVRVTQEREAAARNAYGRALLARGKTSAGRQEQEAALALWQRVDNTPGIILTLHELGANARRRGDTSRAAQYFEESIQLARDTDDELLAAGALLDLGNVALERQELAQAEMLFTRSLRQARQSGNVFLLTSVLNNLGEVARLRGDLAGASAFYEEALRSARLLGDRLSVILPRLNLAEISRLTGEIPRAQTMIEECLQIVRNLGEAFLTAQCLFATAMLSNTQERTGRAALLLGAVVGLQRTTEAEMAVADPEDKQRLTESLRLTLGDIRFAIFLERGAAEPLENILAFALSPLDELPSV